MTLELCKNKTVSESECANGGIERGLGWSSPFSLLLPSDTGESKYVPRIWQRGSCEDELELDASSFSSLSALGELLQRMISGAEPEFPRTPIECRREACYCKCSFHNQLLTYGILPQSNPPQSDPPECHREACYCKRAVADTWCH